MNSLLYKTSQKIDTKSSRNLVKVSLLQLLTGRRDYIKKIDNILSDQKKLSTAILKDDTLLNFAVNQEKRIDKVIKNFLSLRVPRKKTRSC